MHGTKNIKYLKYLLDLWNFVVDKSLMMAPWRRNMQELAVPDTKCVLLCFYFNQCIWLGFKNMEWGVTLSAQSFQANAGTLPQFGHARLLSNRFQFAIH